jgi:predicted amidohydrolase
MRLAALQYDIAWQRKSENWSVMTDLLSGADLPEGSLVLLPEMSDTGFTMDAWTAVGGDSLQSARDLATTARVGLCVGHAAPGEPRPWNAATLMDCSGRVLGSYRKMHLFSPGREPAHYQPGDTVAVLTYPADGRAWKVCPLVCYDLRFPELFRIAALAGAEVFLVGANWPRARAAHWRALAIARAIENQAYVVACNRVGNDPHTEYAGGSLIVGPDGTVLAEGDDTTRVVQAVAEHATLARWRERFPALRDARRALIGDARVDTAPIS